MIACKSCGHRNEDGDGFCGSCGAYLGWSDASVEQAVGTGHQAAASAEAAPVTTLPPPTTVDLTSLESELDAHRKTEEARAQTAAAEQVQREAAAAQAKAEAEARARTEELATTRAQQAAEAEARAKAEAEARTAREAQARAEAEAQTRAREAAEARAEAERQAKALAEAQQGGLAEAEAKQREHSEALARAEADRLAAQEAQAQAEARAAEEARARQEAEVTAQTAIRQKEEAEAVAAAQARAVADAEAARVAADAAAARAAEEAKQADAAKRAAALVARLPPAAVAPSVPLAPQTSPTLPPPPGGPTVGVATNAEMPPPSAGMAPGAGTAPPGAVLPGAPAPMEQKPGAPIKQRADKSTEQARKPIHHGDLICGQCGEGNLPARKFCRRCGGSLVDAKVNKVPWWRRLLTREPRHIEAGVRPQRDPKQRTLPGRIKYRLGRMFGTGKRVFVWLLVLAVAIIAISPYRNTVKKRVSTYYTQARQFIAPKYEPVIPISASAPFGSTAGFPPQNAIDVLSNTHWASDPHSPLVKQIVLIVNYQQPETIRKIGFRIGDQDTPQAYASEPRPRNIHLVYVHADGTHTNGHDITVNDVQGFQYTSIDAKKVVAIEIHINSLYSSIVGNSTSVAEVETFKLQ